MRPPPPLRGCRNACNGASKFAREAFLSRSTSSWEKGFQKFGWCDTWQHYTWQQDIDRVGGARWRVSRLARIFHEHFSRDAFWESSAQFCSLCCGSGLHICTYLSNLYAGGLSRWHGIGEKFKTIGLERCLAGARHSSSAQWLVQQGILSASKVILDESELILTAQVDWLKAFRGQRRGRSSEF